MMEPRLDELINKNILDACCGSRMFWFNKQNQNVLYQDNRSEEHILCDGRKLEVKPDIVADFRQMPYKDETFILVVFDPPHLAKAGERSWLKMKYGLLNENWKEDLRKGFSECFRVLKTNGVLVFKWNEDQIKVSEILQLTEVAPLFGHTTGRHGKTHWITFMKTDKTSHL